MHAVLREIDSLSISSYTPVQTYSNAEVWKHHTGIGEGLVVHYMPVQHIELVIGHCILQRRKESQSSNSYWPRCTTHQMIQDDLDRKVVS